MLCVKCGEENVDGAKFCNGCGSPMEETNNLEVNADLTNTSTDADISDEVANSKIEEPKKANKKKSLWALIIIGVCSAIVAFLAFIVILFVAIGGRKTINLNKYTTFTSSGYDGYGYVNPVIDWEGIEEDYGSKLSFTRYAKNENEAMVQMMRPIDVIKASVSMGMDKSSELTNGDKVTYTWTVDENLSKYVKCKMKFKNDKYVVSGLLDVGTFDAFEGLSLTYTGTAPYANASINYTGTEMETYDFQCDKTSGLSNGDVIKVSIDTSRVDYYIQNLGKAPAELEKEFTVEGLSSSLKKLSEIDDKSLESMQKQATDVYQAYVAQDWLDSSKIETLTYIGDYLLTAKSEEVWGEKNTLVLVYKVQARNNFTYDGNTYNALNDVYWYISYQDLVIDPNGKIVVDLNNYSTPSEGFTIDSGVKRNLFFNQTWYYKGFQTLDNLYKEAVQSKIDEYNHEDNVNESTAPKSAKETTAVSGN